MTRNNYSLPILLFSLVVLVTNACSDTIKPLDGNYKNLCFNSSTNSTIMVKSSFVSEVTSFCTKGFYSDKNQWFPDRGEGEVETGRTYTEYPWREGVEATFFAYSNIDEDMDEVNITSDGVIYKKTGININAGDGTDVVLGRYTGDGKVGGTFAGTASLEFYHPLASVILKVGELPSDFRITRVGFSGIYSSGQTELTSSTGVQNGVAQFEWTNCAGKGKTIQLVTGSLLPKGFQIGEPFFLIPQDFSEQEACVFMNTEVYGRQYEFSIPISEGAISTGKTTVFELNYTDAGPIFSTPTVTDWGEEEPISIVY